MSLTLERSMIDIGRTIACLERDASTLGWQGRRELRQWLDECRGDETMTHLSLIEAIRNIDGFLKAATKIRTELVEACDLAQGSVHREAAE